MYDAKNRNDIVAVLCLLFFNIFNYIRNVAFQNTAKIVDFHCADSIAFFHVVDGCATDIVFVYKGIRGDIFFF